MKGYEIRDIGKGYRILGTGLTIWDYWYKIKDFGLGCMDKSYVILDEIWDYIYIQYNTIQYIYNLVVYTIKKRSNIHKGLNIGDKGYGIRGLWILN